MDGWKTGPAIPGVGNLRGWTGRGRSKDGRERPYTGITCKKNFYIYIIYVEIGLHVNVDNSNVHRRSAIVVHLKIQSILCRATSCRITGEVIFFHAACSFADITFLTDPKLEP